MFTKSELLEYLRDNYIRHTLHRGEFIVVNNYVCLKVMPETVHIDWIVNYKSKVYVSNYDIIKDKTDPVEAFVRGLKSYSYNPMDMYLCDLLPEDLDLLSKRLCTDLTVVSNLKTYRNVLEHLASKSINNRNLKASRKIFDIVIRYCLIIRRFYGDD